MALRKPADVTRVLRFVPPPSGDDPQALNLYLSDRFRELYTALSGALRWQNLRSMLFSQETMPAGASPQVVTLSHKLGKVPEIFLWSANLDATTGANKFDLYATAGNRGNWTETAIELTYSWAGANLQPKLDVFVM